MALTIVVELTMRGVQRNFSRKYFSETKQEEMKDNFNKLEQGEESIEKYAHDIITLSRFALEEMFALHIKVYKFHFGLCSSIQWLVVVRKGVILEKVIEDEKQQEYHELDGQHKACKKIKGRQF